MCARLLHVDLHTMCKPTLVFETKDERGERIRVLQARTTRESATYLGDRYTELAFGYYRLFDRTFEAMPDARRILMLGGGGYAWPKHVIANRPDVRMDVVEVDGRVTQLARRYFYLDRLFEEFDLESTGRLGIVCADAAEWLAGQARGPYDAIVNDCFDGGKPVWDLLAEDVLAATRRALVPSGLYLLNVVASLEGDDFEPLRKTVSALLGTFAHVHVVPTTLSDLSSHQNVLVVGTDGTCTFSGELAGLQ